MPFHEEQPALADSAISLWEQLQAIRNSFDKFKKKFGLKDEEKYSFDVLVHTYENEKQDKDQKKKSLTRTISIDSVSSVVNCANEKLASVVSNAAKNLKSLISPLLNNYSLLFNETLPPFTDLLLTGIDKEKFLECISSKMKKKKETGNTYYQEEMNGFKQYMEEKKYTMLENNAEQIKETISTILSSLQETTGLIEVEVKQAAENQINLNNLVENKKKQLQRKKTTCLCFPLFSRKIQSQEKDDGELQFCLQVLALFSGAKEICDFHHLFLNQEIKKLTLWKNQVEEKLTTETEIDFEELMKEISTIKAELNEKLNAISCSQEQLNKQAEEIKNENEQSLPNALIDSYKSLLFINLPTMYEKICFELNTKEKQLLNKMEGMQYFHDRVRQLVSAHTLQRLSLGNHSVHNEKTPIFHFAKRSFQKEWSTLFEEYKIVLANIDTKNDTENSDRKDMLEGIKKFIEFFNTNVLFYTKKERIDPLKDQRQKIESVCKNKDAQLSEIKKVVKVDLFDYFKKIKELTFYRDNVKRFTPEFIESLFEHYPDLKFRLGEIKKQWEEKRYRYAAIKASDLLEMVQLVDTSIDILCSLLGRTPDSSDKLNLSDTYRNFCENLLKLVVRERQALLNELFIRVEASSHNDEYADHPLYSTVSEIQGLPTKSDTPILRISTDFFSKYDKNSISSQWIEEQFKLYIDLNGSRAQKEKLSNLSFQEEAEAVSASPTVLTL